MLHVFDSTETIHFLISESFGSVLIVSGHSSGSPIDIIRPLDLDQDWYHVSPIITAFQPRNAFDRIEVFMEALKYILILIQPRNEWQFNVF